MCAGYAKEIQAWLCNDVEQARENAIENWSEAFTEKKAFSPSAGLENSRECNKCTN